jgi:hypothetical protein
MSVSKEMENWSAKSVGKMGPVRKYYSAYRTESDGNRKSLPSIGCRLSGVGQFSVGRQLIIGRRLICLPLVFIIEMQMKHKKKEIDLFPLHNLN